MVTTVWKTKFLEHSPENRCLVYVLYKIPLTQADFLLAQLKIYSHWQAGKANVEFLTETTLVKYICPIMIESLWTHFEL